MSGIKKVKDVRKSNAACDKIAEGSKSGDEQEEDNKKTQKTKRGKHKSRLKNGPMHPHNGFLYHDPNTSKTRAAPASSFRSTTSRLAWSTATESSKTSALPS